MQLGTSAIPLLPAVAVGAAVVLAVLVCWGVSRARRAPATAGRSAPEGVEGDAPIAEDWTGEAAGGAADPPPAARPATVADVVAARQADTSPFPTVPVDPPNVDEVGAPAAVVAATDGDPGASTDDGTVDHPVASDRGERTAAVPVVEPVGGRTPAATGSARTDDHDPTASAAAAPVVGRGPVPADDGTVTARPAPNGPSGATPRHALLHRDAGGAGVAQTPVRPATGPRHASVGGPTAPEREAPPVHDPWDVAAEPDPWAAPAPPAPTAALATPDSTADATPDSTAAGTADATPDPIADPTAAATADSTAAATVDPTAAATTDPTDDSDAGPAALGPAAEPNAPAAAESPAVTPAESPAAERAESPAAERLPSSTPDPVARWAVATPADTADPPADGPRIAPPDGVGPETAEDSDGVPAGDPVEPGTHPEPGPVPPPWSASRSAPQAVRDAEPAPPISVAVAQTLAAREMQRARGVVPDGVGATTASAAPDARDRLLSVLLADPVAALGAASELDSTRARIDRLGDVLRRRRTDLATAVHRLHASGLTGEQIGRLSGLGDEDVRAILERRTEEEGATER